MKLIIDMPEETLREVNRCGLFLCPRDKERLINSIKHGTPIPENATNGDMIKTMFPKVVAKQHITSLSLTEVMRAGIDCDVYTSKYKFFTLWFPSEWWNALYKGGDTE